MLLGLRRFFFDLSNLVTHRTRFFVFFRFDRLFHFATQPDQLRSFLTFLSPLRWGFSLMLVFPVYIEDQRFELFLEAEIIIRATESALIAEFVEADAADRANLLVELGKFFGRLT